MRKGVHTVQTPSLRKLFKKSGGVSVKESFSYASSSFNFWESVTSAANGEKKIKRLKTQNS